MTRVLLFALVILCFQSKAESIHNELANSSEWRRLLHFKPGAKKSDIIDPKFFLSQKGNMDPLAELEASIHAMKLDSKEIDEELRFVCRFPAREMFLHQNLKIKRPPSCLTYEAWRKRADPEAIVYVYAAQFAGNPASVFGHSFLRFDRSQNSGLLGFSLSYFALAKQKDNGIVYAYKGLTGGYLGLYEFDHYYPKARGYSDVENRDMWEYELKLTPIERQKIFAHAWELSLAGKTPYYFMDENCTYQLLRLLEVGNTQFNFTDQHGFFITPLESAKLLDEKGLIQKSTYRPSQRRYAEAKLAKLNSSQKKELVKVLDKTLAPENITDPQTLSAVGSALALSENTQEKSNSSLYHRTTRARSRLPMLKEEEPVTPENPLESHKTQQVKVGALHSTKNDNLVSLSFRPALHGLDDFAAGYLPNSQLELLNTEIRVDNKQKIEVQQIKLAEIKSLYPVNAIGSGLSWTTKAAYEKFEVQECKDGCSQFSAMATFGYAAELGSKAIAYALAGPSIAAVFPARHSGVRLGPSAILGSVYRPSDKWVLRFEERLDYFFTSPFSKETLLNSDLAITYHFNPNFSISGQATDRRSLMRTFYNTEYGIYFSRNF